MMTLDTAKNVIKSAFDFCNDRVYFVFQGGEPLLAGLDFFEGFVKLVNELNQNNNPVSYSLQTNGTLLDENWCKFFKKNRFLLGVSLDGDREINSYRVYKDDSESFDDVLKGIVLLKSYAVDFNVLSVLTKRTANSFRKAYRFFKQNELYYLQFIPCLKPFDSVENDYSMSNQDYFDYLKEAYKLYYNDSFRYRKVSLRQMDNYRLIASGQNAEQCGMNGVCSNQFVVEGDGSLYPCDFYCTDEWCIGNINTTSFKEAYNNEKTVNFIKESFILKDECKNCQHFYICRGGGCKRNKQAFDYCGAYKQFFAEASFNF